jgi:hypothetical protein
MGLTHEFSASLLARAVIPYKDLVMVSSGAVLFERRVQHCPTIMTYTPPFSAARTI